MTRKRFFLPPTLLLVLTLGLTACGPLSTLNTIVTISEAAVPILQAAGVSIPSAVPAYLADVSQCIAQQGGTVNPTSAQLAQISICLTQLVAPTLSGLPAAVVSIIGQVVKAVEQYIGQVPATRTTLTPAASGPVTLSPSSAKQLHDLAARAGAVMGKCQTLAKQ